MWYRNVLSLVIDYLINFPPPPLSDQIYKPGTIKIRVLYACTRVIVARRQSPTFLFFFIIVFSFLFSSRIFRQPATLSTYSSAFGWALLGCVPGCAWVCLATTPPFATFACFALPVATRLKSLNYSQRSAKGGGEGGARVAFTYIHTYLLRTPYVLYI